MQSAGNGKMNDKRRQRNGLIPKRAPIGEPGDAVELTGQRTSLDPVPVDGRRKRQDSREITPGCLSCCANYLKAGQPPMGRRREGTHPPGHLHQSPEIDGDHANRDPDRADGRHFAIGVATACAPGWSFILSGRHLESGFVLHPRTEGSAPFGPSASTSPTLTQDAPTEILIVQMVAGLPQGPFFRRVGVGQLKPGSLLWTGGRMEVS